VSDGTLVRAGARAESRFLVPQAGTRGPGFASAGAGSAGDVRFLRPFTIGRRARRNSGFATSTAGPTRYPDGPLRAKKSFGRRGTRLCARRRLEPVRANTRTTKIKGSRPSADGPGRFPPPSDYPRGALAAARDRPRSGGVGRDAGQDVVSRSASNDGRRSRRRRCDEDGGSRPVTTRGFFYSRFGPGVNPAPRDEQLAVCGATSQPGPRAPPIVKATAGLRPHAHFFDPASRRKLQGLGSATPIRHRGAGVSSRLASLYPRAIRFGPPGRAFFFFLFSPGAGRHRPPSEAGFTGGGRSQTSIASNGSSWSEEGTQRPLVRARPQGGVQRSPPLLSVGRDHAGGPGILSPSGSAAARRTPARSPLRLR